MRRAARLLLLATAALGCSAPERPPHVLVIVADTLRADRLGAYGDDRGLTPFLDGLAARGTVFAHAYAPSAWTIPSVASLFTSRHVAQHGVVRFESILAGEEHTLAEALRSAGYATAGFSANFRLEGELGWGQGFETWEVLEPAPHARDEKTHVDAAALAERALAWVDAEADRLAREPAFVYLQFMDPHSPYESPDAFTRRFLPAGVPASRIEAVRRELRTSWFAEPTEEKVRVYRALYDGAVAYLDSELRRLFAALEQRGFLDGALVVFTADHGEEFLEHGFVLHGFNLFEESVRVPLLLQGPGVPAGAVVDAPVSLVDLAPTVLDLLGLRPDASHEGRSLAPLASGRGGTHRDLLLELPAKETAQADFFRSHGVGLVRGRRKLLVNPKGELALYALDDDPAEQHPRDPSAEPGGDELRAELARRMTGAARGASPAREGAPLDGEAVRALRALGYLVE